MSYPNRDIFLTRTEQESIRKLLDEKKVKTVTDFLSKAVEQVKTGKGWAESIAVAAPWLKDVAEVAGTAIPIISAAAKLIEKWSQPTLWELGAIACTLAYQNAVKDALAKTEKSVEQYRQAQAIDVNIARQIRDAAPAEEADLSTFSFEDAASHIFVRRADRALKIALDALGFSGDEQAKIFNNVHDGFIDKLKLLLADAKTTAKFEPFRTTIVDLTTGEKRLRVALAAHAEYQREQYAADPVFRIEPFALKDVYVDTECGFLRWGEIHPPVDLRRHREDGSPMAERIDPFLEKHGGRHNLVETVMTLIRDENFKEEPIVIQGYAGAGKSSFTLRLCDELLKKGFCPVRVRLKKLTLGHSLFDVLPAALEVDDGDRQFPFRDGIKLRDHFSSVRHGQTNICRYVLILDGWDELSLAENRGFKDSVQEMLRQVRSEVLARDNRMRVVVTGRPSEDVAAATSFLRADTPVLTVRPIRPDQLRNLVKDVKRALDEQPIAVASEARWTIPDLTRFEQIFEQYKQDFASNLPESTEIEDFDPIVEEQDDVELVDTEVVENEEGEEEFTEVEEDDYGLFAPPLIRRRRGYGGASLDVLGSPLLAHLAVRVMARTTGDLMKLVNQPTRLYRQLTDMTCERAGKFFGDARDTSSERGQWLRLEGNDLRWLLQRTAAAMTVGGKEYISREQLERRIQHEDDGWLEALTEKLKRENPLSALMISFFFKGGHPQLGCEFAHKSFREYLTAEAIVECLKEFGGKAERQNLPPRVEVETGEENPLRDLKKARDFAENDSRWKLSRELSKLLAPQWLKTEVLSHLRELLVWEIERAYESLSENAEKLGQPTNAVSFTAWKSVRDGLAELWAWWVDGVHLRPQWEAKGRKFELVPPYVHELSKWAAPLNDQESYDGPMAFEPSAAMDAHLGEGLFQLNAWVHFFIAEADGWLLPRTEAENSPTPDELWQGVSARKIYRWDMFEEVVSGEGVAPHRFQSAITQGERQWRVFAPSEAGNDLFHYCIARINSASGRSNGSFPCYGEGQGIDLRGARLDGARLDGASLDGARLDGARLDGARLDGASLDGARLDRASLVGASLVGASLDGASLDGASLDGASLDRASLDRASLDGARLDGASLDGASLDGASLDGASLDRARLDGASLDRARLDGASLDGARLDGASLDGARLDGARLDRARLDGASLDGASLDGASLDRASLDGASLDRASLDRASLDRASLDRARYLTLEQLESAWIDEATSLPEEFEGMKPEILEKQQQRLAAMEAEEDIELVEVEEDDDK